MVKTGPQKNIVVIGASGHAKVVVDIIEQQGLYRIAGLLDDKKPVGQKLAGYPILGPTALLAEIREKLDIHGGIIAVGDNWTRRRVVEAVENLVPGFLFVQAVHPGAWVGARASVERGTVLMAGAVVNCDSSVGEFCIINTRASLDHDCTMEDYSSLAPGAVTGGDVFLGAFSAVGIGACILQGRTVGQQTVVGAGALVVRDLPEYCVAYGSPAKVIRSRQAGERYLSSGAGSSHGSTGRSTGG